VLVLIGVGSTGSDPIPTAQRADAIPAIGAVFPGGVGSAPNCTASVIRSSAGDVVLTSAHCLSGRGQGVQIAPGYHDGLTPYGVWDVTAVYADPRWVSTQDPQHDYVFLTVAAQQRQGRTVRLGDVVVGNTLGLAPRTGDHVQVVAYPFDADDYPVTCTTATYAFAGFPAFDCGGYVPGSSGAPWLIRTQGHSPVVGGIIGGLHQGGCLDHTSYSPRFDQDTLAVYDRAVRAGLSDTLPAPAADDC